MFYICISIIIIYTDECIEKANRKNKGDLGGEVGGCGRGSEQEDEELIYKIVFGSTLHNLHVVYIYIYLL